MLKSHSEILKYISSNTQNLIKSESKDNSLDYSEESLQIIDKTIRHFASYLDHINDDEVKDILIVEIGSYILEMAYRKFAGTFHWDNHLHQPVLVIGKPIFEISLLTFGRIKLLLEKESNEENIILFWIKFVKEVNIARTGDKKQVV